MSITPARREYLRKYQAKWLKKRRKDWVRENGPCVLCGSWIRLEIDHENPAIKAKQTGALWSLREDRRIAELRKCRVLCHKCHKQKTAVEQRRRWIEKLPITHGTIQGYNRRCRCLECKAAYSVHRKERYRLKGN